MENDISMSNYSDLFVDATAPPEQEKYDIFDFRIIELDDAVAFCQNVALLILGKDSTITKQTSKSLKVKEESKSKKEE